MNCQSDTAGATSRPAQLINCYDAAAFALPAQFTFGNAPRNVLRGPKFVEHRPVADEERAGRRRRAFQIRVEIFNIFNTVNYGNPNASFGSAAFGRITSAGTMRQMQLGGKLLF